MIFNIHPLNMISALSSALELSTGGLSKHHLRTALIASKIAKEIGIEDHQFNQLIYASLIHDLGAASNWEERTKLGNLYISKDMYAHAEAGYELLREYTTFYSMAEVVRHHHDRYDGSSPLGVREKAIPLNSRIIHLADRLEISIKENVNIFDQKDAIMAQLQGMEGYFDPELVKGLEAAAESESFWLDLVNVSYHNNFLRKIDAYGLIRFNINDIVNIGEIFGTIINRMSPFTAAHSHRVAKVAEFLAETIGYSQDEVKTMRVAGLFHDLGKLAIPNSILDKPGKLTDYEYLQIKQHPYYTYRILEQIDGFDIIAEWAAFHHEALDGTGYPFRIKSRSLRLGSRIVATADIFVALTEKRPYREQLSMGETQRIMTKMINAGKLDGTLVGEIFSNVSNLPRDISRYIEG